MCSNTRPRPDAGRARKESYVADVKYSKNGGGRGVKDGKRYEGGSGNGDKLPGGERRRSGFITGEEDLEIEAEIDNQREGARSQAGRDKGRTQVSRRKCRTLRKRNTDPQQPAFLYSQGPGLQSVGALPGPGRGVRGGVCFGGSR